MSSASCSSRRRATARSSRTSARRTGDREDRDARLDERERAVLEVGRGIRVGEDLRELLELERPFARGGVLEAAGEDQRTVAAAWRRRSARCRVRGRAPRRGRPGCRRRPPRSAGSSGSAAESARPRAARRCTSWSPRSPAPDRPRARSTAPPRRPAATAASLVMAMVGAPCARAASMTATMSGDAPDWLIPMTSASVEARRDAVQRHDRRRPERDRQPMPDPEQVLGVDRGVVRGAAGGDDDVTRRASRNEPAIIRPVGLGGQEPRSDLRLLEDLVVEAHRAWIRNGEWPAPVGDSGRAGCWLQKRRRRCAHAWP